MNINNCIYQIYTLGFCGAPIYNDAKLNSRILKVIDWIDYFKQLDIDAILFNPVFQSDKHGYDTRDYKTIDCRLGTNDDFKRVCRTLKQNGIKIILDGVFNHVGRGFWAFMDVQKNREQSAYKDWFVIDFSKNSNYNDGFFYEGWEGHMSLVKLNLKNPQVVAYLFECIKLWIDEFDIDGLRLDVAYCLDHDFLKQLKIFCKNYRQDFFLVGEIIFNDYRQIVNGQMLDSATNYELYTGIHSSLNSLNMHEIGYTLNRQTASGGIYKDLQLMNFIDNHDVSRIASILKNDKNLICAYGLLFTVKGLPCLYYASEWGILGDKKSGDDALRPCVETYEKNNLYWFVKKLIEIRKNSDVLKFGEYKNIVVSHEQLIFERTLNGKKIIVIVNAAGKSYAANLNHKNAYDMIAETALDTAYGLVVPPHSCMILEISQ